MGKQKDKRKRKAELLADLQERARWQDEYEHGMLFFKAHPDEQLAGGTRFAYSYYYRKLAEGADIETFSDKAVKRELKRIALSGKARRIKSYD